MNISSDWSNASSRYQETHKKKFKKSLNIICSKYSSHHLGQSEIIEVLQLTIQANLYIFNFAFEIS